MNLKYRISISILLVLFFIPLLYSLYLLLIQKPFADDWFMLEIARELHGKPLLDWITVLDPYKCWRPLVYNMKGLYLCGQAKSLVLYNIIKVLLYLTTGGLVYLTSRFVFGVTRSAAIIILLLFFYNPTNVGATQTITHIFKITGTLFYGISVGLLWLYLEQNKRTYCVLAFLTFIISFYSDADALAIFPAIVFLLFIYSRKIGIKKSLVIFLTALCIVSGYLYLRSIVVGGAFAGGTEGRQDIVLNYNIILNVLKMFASTFTFTMSPYVFLKKTFYVLIGSFFLMVNIFIMCVAFIKSNSETRKRIFILMGLAFIAMIPFVLIRHVSEIYTFRCAYLFMIVLGYSIRLIYDNFKASFKIIISIYTAFMIFSGICSFLCKQEMVLKRGIRAENMVTAMKLALPSPPHYSTIELDTGDWDFKNSYSDFINVDKQIFLLPGYCVRYIYQDATLNSKKDSSGISFCLKWNSATQTFILINS